MIRKLLPTQLKALRRIHATSSRINITRINSNLRSLSTTTTSSSAAGSDAKNSSGLQKMSFEDYDDYDPTEQEGGSIWGAIFSVSLILTGLACVGFAVKEMLPTRMNANSLFSETFDLVRNHDEIKFIIGQDIKGYGSGTEGRRSHIDSREYEESSDNSKRLRVRYTVEGGHGKMLVYAEISNKIPKDLVYLICQDRRTGRVITLVDNRDRLHELSDNSADSIFFPITSLFSTK